MNLLIEAAEYVIGDSSNKGHELAAKLRRLEEVAGELDDGLAQRIDEEFMVMLQFVWENAHGGDPTLGIEEVVHSSAQVITTAVTEAIAGAVEFGRQLEREKLTCRTCGHCERDDCQDDAHDCGNIKGEKMGHRLQIDYDTCDQHSERDEK